MIPQFHDNSSSTPLFPFITVIIFVMLDHKLTFYLYGTISAIRSIKCLFAKICFFVLSLLTFFVLEDNVSPSSNNLKLEVSLIYPDTRLTSSFLFFKTSFTFVWNKVSSVPFFLKIALRQPSQIFCHFLIYCCSSLLKSHFYNIFPIRFT